MMPMISSTEMVPIAGLRENALIIQIPMELAVLFPALLHLILRKDLIWIEL